jgi:hypothetical protein
VYALAITQRIGYLTMLVAVVVVVVVVVYLTTLFSISDYIASIPNQS